MATGDERQDPRIARISSAIRVIPDFPKPGNYKVCLYSCLSVFYPLLIYLCLIFIVFLGETGIMFQDITTLLLDTKAFKDTIDLFVEVQR